MTVKHQILNAFERGRASVAKAMSEDELLSNVITNAQLKGWLAYHIRNSRKGVVQGDIGFPDVVLCRPPRLLVVELKRESGKPTPDQVRWLGDLAACGAEMRLWRPMDWLEGRISAELDRG